MKIKHLLALAALAVGSSAWAQWTDITNGDGLAFSTKTGFGTPGTQKTTVHEIWTNNASAAFDLNQTVASVPAGIYELSANAMYRASYTYGDATNCVLYANIGGQTFSTPIKNYADCTAREDFLAVANAMVNHKSYNNKISYIVVESDATDATIGMKSNGALTFCNNGYWFIYNQEAFSFKNVTNDYYAKLKSQAETMVSEAAEGDAKTALQDALATYSSATVANVKGLKEAIDTYLWTAASDENPIDITSNIENPSFEGGQVTYWFQDFGWKQPSPAANMAQPKGWDLVYSGPKVNNSANQSFTTQTAGAKDGNCLYVRHRWGDVLAVENLRQSLRDLPAGKYQLTVAVKGGSSVTDANTLTLTAGSSSNTTTIDNFDKSNYKDYSVTVIKADAESTLDICYGLKQTAGNEQLYYIDDFRLSYLGDPLKAAYNELIEKYNSTTEPEGKYYSALKAELASAKTAAKDMYDNKTAANTDDVLEKINDIDAVIEKINDSKNIYANLNTTIEYAKTLSVVDPSYTALSTAITNAEAVYADCSEENPLTALENAIKAANVADDSYVTSTYQYAVELGNWTTTGYTANFNNEHWSGETRNYKNQDDSNGRGWNSSTGFNISFSQDVTLPAGKYVFKVAGRKSADAVLEMSVKKGEEILGSVNDFPSGNVGLGINKSGAASFDAEDAVGFAGSTGKGWQWRFIQFTLEEDATVKVSVNANASSIHQWISFGDYTVQTDNEANISMIAYNIAKNDANLAISDDANAIIVGSEKTDLQNAIDATPGSTKDEIDVATEALKTALATFNAARPSYVDYDNAKTEAETYGAELPYASATKKEAIATAVAAVPTEAADATAKATAIRNAYRAYIESNAMAEGVDGATDVTGLISNPKFETDLEGWTSTQAGGTLRRMDGESPTYADGSSLGYYDYNNGSANNQHAQQTIENLPAGRYLFTVTVRAATGLNPVYVYSSKKQSNNTEIEKIGASGGAFGRGWNDYTVVIDNDKTQNVTVGVITDPTNGNKGGWFGFTNARLVKIADAATMAVNATAKYGTFCAPFEVEVPAGVEASTATLEGTTVVLESVGETIPANTPVILFAEDGLAATTIYGKAVEGEPVEGVLTGTYTQIYAPEGAYVLQKQDKVGFYKVESNDIPVGANRAYLTAPASANIRAFFFDGETAISAIKAFTSGNAEIYNLNGVKLNGLQKGINIVNGKKVLVK